MSTIGGFMWDDPARCRLTIACLHGRERHTDYRGFFAADPVVQWFWEVSDMIVLSLVGIY